MTEDDPSTADYLIMGAGAVGMAFADSLLTHSTASMVIVDRHHRPGGHWNDAYPFVRLHQPASFYGVSAQQAMTSGISAYAPGSGWLASSIALIWSLDLAPQWVVVGNLEGRRLQGDAAHSPLSERRSNYYATVGLAYRF